MPFTKIIVGTRIGTRAAIVPLVIYTAPFLARLLETSLLEVGGGIIEAAQSMGATTFQIIVHFVLPEAFASVILALTTGTIALIGATAMAGYIGGGGIGNIALTYGYQTFNFPADVCDRFHPDCICLDHPESGKPAVTEEPDTSVTYNLFLLKKLLI